MDNKKHMKFSSRWGFILSAVGSAVGMANVWGFPAKMGANGGGAFFAVYKNGGETVAYELEFVLAASLAAFTADGSFVLQLAEHEVDCGLEFGIGDIFAVWDEMLCQ